MKYKKITFYNYKYILICPFILLSERHIQLDI
jgi:hypothetical protein